MCLKTRSYPETNLQLGSSAQGGPGVGHIANTRLAPHTAKSSNEVLFLRSGKNRNSRLLELAEWSPTNVHRENRKRANSSSPLHWGLPSAYRCRLTSSSPVLSKVTLNNLRHNIIQSESTRTLAARNVSHPAKPTLVLIKSANAMPDLREMMRAMHWFAAGSFRMSFRRLVASKQAKTNHGSCCLSFASTSARGPAPKGPRQPRAALEWAWTESTNSCDSTAQRLLDNGAPRTHLPRPEQQSLGPIGQPTALPQQTLSTSAAPD